MVNINSKIIGKFPFDGASHVTFRPSNLGIIGSVLLGKKDLPPWLAFRRVIKIILTALRLVELKVN